MKRLILILFFSASAAAQTHSVFDRVMSEVRGSKIDTTSVPEDKLTREIRKLREVGGGFNIDEAISFKISEDVQKGDLSETEAQELHNFISTGNGKKWLDNAVMRIYRAKFTVREIKSLVKFYRSLAGRKMSDEFPAIMIQSLRAAESLVEQWKSGAKP